MRKVILFIGMSLDGFIADTKNGVEWMESDLHIVEEDPRFQSMYNNIDTAIMGRTTYDQVMFELSGTGAYFYHDIHSIVMSRSGKGDANGHDVTFTNDQPEQIIAELQKQEGKDIWIIGGAQVARAFIDANLIDEYQIAIIPKILGDGVPLFTKTETIKLRLDNVEAFNEIAYLTYTKS